MEQARDDRRTDDAEEERGAHAARVEPQRDDQTDEEREDRSGAERGQRDDRRAARREDDDAGVDEPDEQDEQADADADRALERQRDRVEDRLAEVREHEDRDRDAFHEDDPHRGRPRQRRLAEHELERDDRIESEPRGHCEGAIRVEAHRDREHARAERGHRDGLIEAGTEVLALQIRDADVVQDDRVERDDVGHHEECRDPTDDLGADRRRVLLELEPPFENAHVGRTGH